MKTTSGFGASPVTKRLAISARQVTAICRGAAKAGHIPELVIDGVTVRLLPEHAVINVKASEQALDDEIDFWSIDKAAHISRREAAADPEKNVQRHYNAIGYDPSTMSDDDYSRLYKEAEDRWRASIPGTPLGRREQKAITQLAAHGVGVAVRWSEVKDCGPDTEERLTARGFIELRYQSKFPDRIESYVLTEEGQQAANALRQHP